jgi:hypothetical protein
VCVKVCACACECVRACDVRGVGERACVSASETVCTRAHAPRV